MPSGVYTNPYDAIPTPGRPATTTLLRNQLVNMKASQSRGHHDPARALPLPAWPL